MPPNKVVVQPIRRFNREKSNLWRIGYTYNSMFKRLRLIQEFHHETWVDDRYVMPGYAGTGRMR